MSNDVRVRYAPSPTGHLHIGNARTALFNYLFTKHFGGKFIIRTEDTDQKRNVEGGEESQLNYLKWLGLTWDEGADVGGDYGPYRQMERLDIYEKYVNELLERGLAYKCYMTEEELDLEREEQRRNHQTPKYSGAHRDLSAAQIEAFEKEGREASIRFRVPENTSYTFNDIVRGDITFESSDFGDWVMVKKNGIPTYNFAVAVDDHLMEISHVLRGEEHISNTPKQRMIFDAFGWEAPQYGHMTLILNEERKKLSKRDQHILQFIEQYKNLGYLPEAMFNFIGLLGWSPVGEEEIFTHDQFVEIFDPERLSTSAAIFDPVKLKWMNNQYIKQLSAEEVVELTMPHLMKAGKLTDDMSEATKQWATDVILLYKDQLNYGAEIIELTELFFQTDLVYGEKEQAVLAEEQVNTVLTHFLSELEALESLDADAVKAAIKATQKATKVKGKGLFMPIRVATTGQMHGPELPQAIALLGKAVVTTRLKALISEAS
ncbi:glutamyl-tRNA synthetase /glutamate--tRNA(Gln) ligase [Streptohalobacillus salinus]|uniref:Glutamate--tRNA ligase n=1 Tax=Streptohalobacillus salinus TaxID=621096 RepID=A0A2V3W3I3_9BACI|nr:glutamate--tRNA ligase [Streptohalobacillus salinus]PXW87744.1 glutamyl-tRNA synthetase /glutamate--tRNA(Gln) ligase [Streptohalobacillus salinus]